MSKSKTITLEEKHGANNYAPLSVVLVKGEGCKVWDEDGKEYIDFMSAYSAHNAGHNNPVLMKAFLEQAQKLVLTSRAFYNDKLGPFLDTLCNVTGLDMALPMNTGAEAVETAIKAARRWGYRVKGIPENKAEIIVSSGNFHGRTTTIISFSSDEDDKTDFGPYTPGFKEIPFGDADALEKAITLNTCAFLTEPIQGEGGIIIPEEGWLRNVREICTKNNVLLILDEIQSGMGRTGKNFAYEHEGITPDGLTLAKALGGGLLPVSAFVARRDILELFEPGSHGSTWGGNPLAAVVGKVAIEYMVEEKLSERSAELGAYLLEELKKINSPYIRDIRGIGLWVGVDIDPDKISAKEVCMRLKEAGILAKETAGTILRFAPPLVIDKALLDESIKRIRSVFAEI